jgi:catechol 2,3-dioxygenase-like lactoylglutathione lyase family enzyme
MKVKRLDHIALYMGDRGAAAGYLTTHLGFHVVDHTERYTLVGAGGKLGKLTLFDAPQGMTPSPGEIERITIRVADPEAAAARLPAGAEPSDGGYLFTGPEASSCDRDLPRSQHASSWRWASPQETKPPP